MLTASETGLKIKAVQIWLSLQIEGTLLSCLSFA